MILNCLNNSWTLILYACFTTECGSPRIRKSMSALFCVGEGLDNGSHTLLVTECAGCLRTSTGGKKWFLWTNWKNLVLLVFLLLLIGTQNHLHSIFKANLRTESLKFPARCRRFPRCSSPWPTYSSSERFWPTIENCLCFKIQFWFPLHIYLVNSWLWPLTKAQFWCSLWSNLAVQMFLRLLEECIHDKPLHEIVRILQCLSSWRTFRFQRYSGILHPYKMCLICLFVIPFRFVLHIVAIERRSLQLRKSQSKGISVLITLVTNEELDYLRQRVEPFCRERFRILHTFLRLLRKDWADLKK